MDALYLFGFLLALGIAIYVAVLNHAEGRIRDASDSDLDWLTDDQVEDLEEDLGVDLDGDGWVGEPDPYRWERDDGWDD